MWTLRRVTSGRYLWVEIEPLQCVDDQRVFGQPIVHDRVETSQEGRRLDDGLVVGVVEALKPDDSG